MPLPVTFFLRTDGPAWSSPPKSSGEESRYRPPRWQRSRGAPGLTHLCFPRAETERGLSRKHIIEGRAARRALLAPVPSCAAPAALRGCRAQTPDSAGAAGAAGLKASLERLQLEYVDVVFANRPDPNTPMEGGCRAAVLRSSPLPFVALVVGLCQAFISRALSLPKQKRLLRLPGQPTPWLSLCHPQPGARTPSGCGGDGLVAQRQVTAPVPAAADSTLSKSLFYHQGAHLVPPSPGLSS